ncbi:alkaline phosphatase D family protein [Stakelama saccharophila]|uniref:Alkaline phosphatase D family protein n=1 Tax=Stakelama saccharophila TaxID=3075605 RepID=A0ABZ0B4V3_9SPHN|nr:alkaline phosphatase D family protein [Stakelama sp. W311]WNO52416.1 alkaline phosphatase D family protein [Stakelama sp. W311]
MPDYPDHDERRALKLRRRTMLAGMGALAAAPLPVRARRSETGNPRLMQGPMVGAVTGSEILIWGRASGPYRVEIEYADNPDFANARRSAPVQAQAERDFTTVSRLTGLESGRRYYYRPLVEGDQPKYRQELSPYSVRTAPAEPAKIRIAFGSCARVQEDPEQPIWGAVLRSEPDLFLWLGDNIYADSRIPGVMAEIYRRQRDVAGAQPVLRQVPQLAIWDDHDFGEGGADRTFATREQSLALFKQYWANPAYGLPDAPGVFFRYSYGGTDFFFLDDRYYRDPNDMPQSAEKTQIGAAQREWLQQSLLESDAPFKLVIAGGGWTRTQPDEQPVGWGSWASFLHERNALFDFIRDNRIGGVVLLSGDTHAGELNAVPWSARGGYDFYDLVASPLAQDTSINWFRRRPERRIRGAYAGSANFGELEIDAAADRPKLTYKLRNIYGKSVWNDLVLYADELVNGVTSWPGKMSGDGRDWHHMVGDLTANDWAMIDAGHDR